MYPDEKTFTYRANTANGQIKSRLDRIYIARHISAMIYEWVQTPSPVPTDHWLVMIKYAPKEAPQIGKGRWTLPLDLLKDKDFVNQVISKGIHLQQEIDNLPHNRRDRPQTSPQKTLGDL